MERVLRFDPRNCALVRGASGAAVYDFVRGVARALPAGLVPLLDPRADELRLPAEELPRRGEVLELLSLGLLAEEAENPAASAPEPAAEPRGPRPEFAWLELTRACDLRCVHCYASASPERGRSPAMRLEDWLGLLGALRDAGVGDIQLIGGEPLLYPHLAELLLEIPRHGFSTVELFTNGHGLSESMLNLLLAAGGRIASTLYSVDPSVHDAVTLSPGSHAETVDAIRRARSWGLPLRVGCVITSVNEGRMGELGAFVADLGAVYTGADPVRPTGRAGASSCATQIPRALVLPPFATSRASFARNRGLNPCWAGKLAVTDEGELLPCVFARDCAAGNVLRQSFSSALAELEERYWALGKDRIEGCRECEYRYACPDCRPLAMALGDGRLEAKTAGCEYAPAGDAILGPCSTASCRPRARPPACSRRTDGPSSSPCSPSGPARS